MVALRTLIFTVVVPGTVTVLVPYALLSVGSADSSTTLGILRYAGLLPIASGASLYLWCAWQFMSTGKGTPAPIDPPKGLVAAGPYGLVRNPMYLAVVSALAGEALLFESFLLLGYAAGVFAAFFLFVVFYEEPALRRKFGESYERYRRRVPRWIPRGPSGRCHRRG
ncbi:MAG: isoprenylcysteine carboxylmethyltransferase family protein [Gemmatimonadales bacterium]|nr:isoprenylcysteine carboxylmethyltransferase family protein [Gemmatimonadales bacterium]NIN12444.1 isoprenylcysteine carboxylmethyltransferase family protein [Gemmatimonadales bacterium]NIN50820.1 isoprenylcysteine carboxylmethyltransferase family protein [Gemmatimonadales bacterium]NIP08284.1 isoprenylcysteine carboxylmethyltransferase family protein [Gemmatimonadales bacterium]NIR00808.1 isoprenylcysteine carboxylmethyltransferase family protein [Gemmatimonadales bacterium]